MSTAVVQETWCACGCGNPLSGRHSHWFYSSGCQSLWQGFSHLPEPQATHHRDCWRICIEAIMGGPLWYYVDQPMAWTQEQVISEARAWLNPRVHNRPDWVALWNPTGIPVEEIATLPQAYMILSNIRAWRLAQGSEWWASP